MQEFIKKRLKQRKARIFLIFLVLATFAWFINKLSETYVGNLSLKLEYTNLTDSLLLTKALPIKMDAQISAGGFYLFRNNFTSKKAYVSLANVKNKGTDFFITRTNIERQITRQLPQDVLIRELNIKDTLAVNVSYLSKKTVPIIADISIVLHEDYLLRDSVKISPNKITLIGPKNRLASIEEIKTASYTGRNINSSLNETLGLLIPDSVLIDKNISEVLLNVSVFRFSEKIISVPILINGLPNKTHIRTFPEKVNILCRDEIDKIKPLSESDFIVNAIYKDKVKGPKNTLTLEISKQPDSLNTVLLLEKEVHYIMRRE